MRAPTRYGALIENTRAFGELFTEGIREAVAVLEEALQAHIDPTGRTEHARAALKKAVWHLTASRTPRLRREVGNVLAGAVERYEISRRSRPERAALEAARGR